MDSKKYVLDGKYTLDACFWLVFVYLKSGCWFSEYAVRQSLVGRCVALLTVLVTCLLMSAPSDCLLPDV